MLKTHTQNGKTKIVLPIAHVHNTINWYHHILSHAGQERLYKSIYQHMYSPSLAHRVAHFVRHRNSCQRYNNPGQGVGHVAYHMSTLGIPWEEMAIYTIGLWKIDIKNYGTVIFNDFTIINTTTGLLEIKHATQRNPGGLEAIDTLDYAWLKS